MSIPDYQTLMLPFLEAISDGNEHKLRDIIDILSNQFNLSTEERQQLLPSGNQEIIVNRVGWTRTHLKKAGLLEAPRRGVFITTSKFSRDAIEYVSIIEKKIVLIDGPRLANLMVQHNLGVTVKQTYQVKALDTDYFSEDTL